MLIEFSLAALVAGVAGWFALRRAPSSSTPPAAPPPADADALEEIRVTAQYRELPAAPVVGPAWPLPAAGEPYRHAIIAAERRHGIPDSLLARLLWQESRFRPDVIDGRVVSSAGAVGIAQIVPRWHPGVNPLDPFASIDYAAKYLASLKGRFGSWELALAAYNWGQGNLASDLTGQAWPTETKNYVAEITRDVPGALA